MEKILEFANVARLQEFSRGYCQLEDLYLFAHLVPGSKGLTELVETWPLKMGGMMLFLLFSGTPIDVEINMEPYTMGPGSFMVAFPGNVLKFGCPMPTDFNAYVMFFDVKFLQNINVNLTSIAMPPNMQRPSPVQRLDHHECDLLKRYLELFAANTKDDFNPQINKSIASSLSSALVYQLVQFYHKRLAGALEASTRGQDPGRRHTYVRDFMKLVHIHYMHERSVTFYADKLYITPKYLSLLVKEATGRSAARWIDDFVLMEAKNMLRFSGKSIQQIAYTLNFSNQSSFGKYFKHLTGMSPTQYQKS